MTIQQKEAETKSSRHLSPEGMIGEISAITVHVVGVVRVAVGPARGAVAEVVFAKLHDQLPVEAVHDLGELAVHRRQRKQGQDRAEGRALLASCHSISFLPR